MSWSRRVGIAAALLLVVGGSIALAGEALNSMPQPRALVPPPPAPGLLSSLSGLTRDDSTELRVMRPEGLRADQRYVLRLYDGDEQILERPLPAAQEQVRMANVQLRRGENRFAATLTGSGGESPRSTTVVIVRDDLAPEIAITSPANGTSVFAAVTVLAGRTEAGADMTLTKEPSGRELPTSVGDDGRFTSTVELSLGENVFQLRSVDPAGNVGRARVEVVRTQSAATVVLTVSDPRISAAELPRRVTLRAVVHDEAGLPIDGAQVTFGLSPPSQTTRTFRVATDQGVAVWSGIDLEAAAVNRGTWLATVLVTLDSGAELLADEQFVIE